MVNIGDSVFAFPSSSLVFLEHSIRSFKTLEMISCRVLQAHYYISFEDGKFQVKDVEAQRRLSVSEAPPNWFMESIATLMRGSKDDFFQNFGELDQGRMKVSTIRSKFGWMLSGEWKCRVLLSLYFCTLSIYLLYFAFSS